MNQKRSQEAKAGIHKHHKTRRRSSTAAGTFSAKTSTKAPRWTPLILVVHKFLRCRIHKLIPSFRSFTSVVGIHLMINGNAVVDAFIVLRFALLTAVLMQHRALHLVTNTHTFMSLPFHRISLAFDRSVAGFRLLPRKEKQENKHSKSQRFRRMRRDDEIQQEFDNGHKAAAPSK